MRDDPRMRFGDLGEQPVPGHAGFLAGRYRDGAYSDIWTDVSRCADGTFVGYAPACTCGWRGAAQPVSTAGRMLASTVWRQHAAEVQAATEPQAPPPLTAPSGSGRAGRRSRRNVVRARP